MNAPTLTVVTVVYNDEAHIARTVESVLAQDYPAIEYVVVDGASSDGTLAAVEPWRARIAHVLSEPDRGIYDAMNKGIRLATGEFILFMNSGDVFASSTAVSAAMADVASGRDQVIFGRWVRRARGQPDQPCAPDLSVGRFNHQAVLYSRAIHRWHGEYLSIRGLSTADYFFFATLLASPAVDCRTSDTTLAIIDIDGLSSGLQTFSQKYAADYLCGRTSGLKLIAILALHPLYSSLKRLLRGAR